MPRCNSHSPDDAGGIDDKGAPAVRQAEHGSIDAPLVHHVSALIVQHPVCEFVLLHEAR